MYKLIWQSYEYGGEVRETKTVNINVVYYAIM